MQTFRVWAPLPRKVELQLGPQRLPMRLTRDGWWYIEVEDSLAKGDYGFVLDGEGPFPDPRSHFQPRGVHGPSRVVDHGAFHWTDGNFRALPLSQAVLYEMHVGTFSAEGTFDAAIERLAYLRDLGVTHVELMPVNEFPGKHGWGYDGVDLYAPHHAYGGPEGLKRFVNACHARGLAAILDVVYNHIGPSGNYLGKFAPYLTRRYATPWGEAMNFDGPHSDEVRRFCCDNALMWLRDYHFDGLRLDAVDHIVDTGAVHIMEQLATEVSALADKAGRSLVLIAETDVNDPKLLRPRERAGYGLDAQWNDDFHHALHTALTGEQNGYYADFGTLADLAKALEQGYVFDGRYCKFRQRHRGRAPLGLAGRHLLAYVQNHDQVGNRPGGERLSQLVSEGRQKIAAALMLTSPFVPMLFQGEEWAASSRFEYFTDHAEPHLGKAVREGRAAGFEELGWKLEAPPDPQTPAAFTESKLNWDEPGRPPHAAMLDWYRRLLTLRRTRLAGLDASLAATKVQFSEASRWLVATRGALTVAVNLGATQRVPCDTAGREVVLASESGMKIDPNGVTLPPDSVIVMMKPD
jgi:maltooligosyltrehalose trehalohydrolase